MTMAEFALLMGGEFREFRHLEERPPNIPHKAVEWFPVSRVYGDPFEGVEGNAYVVRTVDPATLPAPVPPSVSPRQARLALLAVGKLDAANAAVAQADAATKIAWDFSNEVRRDDPGVIALAGVVGFSLDQLDQLFRDASKL